MTRQNSGNAHPAQNWWPSKNRIVCRFMTEEKMRFQIICRLRSHQWPPLKYSFSISIIWWNEGENREWRVPAIAKSSAQRAYDIDCARAECNWKSHRIGRPVVSSKLVWNNHFTIRMELEWMKRERRARQIPSTTFHLDPFWTQSGFTNVQWVWSMKMSEKRNKKRENWMRRFPIVRLTSSRWSRVILYFVQFSP